MIDFNANSNFGDELLQETKNAADSGKYYLMKLLGNHP
jgi:hypothetical protein